MSCISVNIEELHVHDVKIKQFIQLNLSIYKVATLRSYSYPKSVLRNKKKSKMVSAILRCFISDNFSTIEFLQVEYLEKLTPKIS